MASERLEELKFFHNICLKEHGRALRNLEEYLKKIAVIWKVIQDNETVDLKLFGSAVTEFSKMGEVLRKFNIEVDLSSTTDGPYRLTEESVTQKQPSAIKKVDHCQDTASNSNLTASNAFKTLDPEKLAGVHDINDLSVAKHVQNYEGDCIITNVKDAKEKLVYIIDISPPLEPIDLTKYLKEKPTLPRVPSFGVVFGYLLDNYMFRAVRSGNEFQASEDVSIYLMDLGVLTNVPLESDFFALPDKYQQIPPQAILCRLSKGTGWTETDPEKFLEQNQNIIEQKFRILNCNNILDIEIMPILKQSLEGKPVSFNDNVPSHTFQRHEIPNDIAGPSKQTNNLFDAQNESYIGNNTILHGNRKIQSSTSVSHSGVTVPFKMTNRGAAAYPKVGSTIRIVPTHIVNFDSFYAQIPNQDDNYPSLREFVIDMNKIETADRYRSLEELPCEHELVIAKFIDGNWYRCRVLSVIDEDNIKVFYVDYGNCNAVALQNIRAWDERFDYYPFQAYSCKLDNIEKATVFNAEATDLVRRILLNEVLTATVTNNLNHLSLTVLDTNGDDVGQSLCKMKYAKPKE